METVTVHRRRRVRRRRFKAPAYLALAVSTLVAATLVAAGLTWPSNGLPSPTAAVHEDLADAALKASPADYVVARRENDAVLAAAPLSSTAWVRKAFIIHQQTSQLDAAALDSLEKSYRAAPYGPDITRWRLRFMFENWSSLPPSLKTRAIAELEVFSRFHGGSGALVATIDDPRGRLAARLISRRTYRETLKERHD